MRGATLLLSAAMVVGSIAPAAVAGQDEERELGWSDVAELTFVLTGGNARSNTLGFANTLTRTWERTTFKLESGAIRAEAANIRYVAVGTTDDFSVAKESVSEVTAETYFTTARLDRQFSDRTGVFGSGGWLRNTPAGIESRITGALGISNQWADNEVWRFNTAYGVTYTAQSDVVEVEGVDDSWIGFQVSSEYWRQVTETAQWTTRLVVDGSAEETEDLRGDLTNSLQVAISDRLALKTSLRLLFDNLPAFTEVPFQTGDATVFTELEEVDTTFTVALVVNF